MSNHTQIIGRQADPQVGPKFLAFDNMDLRAMFYGALERTFGTETANGVQVLRPRGGAGMLMQAHLHDLSIDLPEFGGRMTPFMWLKNANNGSAAACVGAGLFHWVCSNGMYIGLPSLVLKIRHVDGPRANELLDVLPGLVAEQARKIQTGELLGNCIDALDQSVPDPVDVLLHLPNVSVRARQVALEQVVNGTHREKDRPDTAWGLYNLVNEAQRRVSRSAYATANRDVSLLEDVLILAQDQESATEGVA